MKKISLCLIFIICLCFSGCINVIEDISTTNIEVESIENTSVEESIVEDTTITEEETTIEIDMSSVTIIDNDTTTEESSIEKTTDIPNIDPDLYATYMLYTLDGVEMSYPYTFDILAQCGWHLNKAASGMSETFMISPNTKAAMGGILYNDAYPKCPLTVYVYNNTEEKQLFENCQIIGIAIEGHSTYDLFLTGPNLIMNNSLTWTMGRENIVAIYGEPDYTSSTFYCEQLTYYNEVNKEEIMFFIFRNYGLGKIQTMIKFDKE